MIQNCNLSFAKYSYRRSCFPAHLLNFVQAATCTEGRLLSFYLLRLLESANDPSMHFADQLRGKSKVKRIASTGRACLIFLHVCLRGSVEKMISWEGDNLRLEKFLQWMREFSDNDNIPRRALAVSQAEILAVDFRSRSSTRWQVDKMTICD